jgi:ribosomal-protein-alanine N-acetyltransferase
VPAPSTVLKIRDATPKDIPSLINLERTAASAAHWSEPQYRKLFSAAASGVQNLVLVAEAGNSDLPFARAASFLGFLVARRISPEWELENIVVVPSARRNGIGYQLLKALLDAARQAKSQAILLEVRESNAAARSFYQKAGFQPLGRRNGYYKDPVEDAVLYRCDLQEPFS